MISASLLSFRPAFSISYLFMKSVADTCTCVFFGIELSKITPAVNNEENLFLIAEVWTTAVLDVWATMWRRLMWSKKLVYHRCHEKMLPAVPNALTAYARSCQIEISDSPVLHVEFPPSWLKYRHIANIFLSMRRQSFNNLQHEGGRWKVTKVSYICLIPETQPNAATFL